MKFASLLQWRSYFIAAFAFAAALPFSNCSTHTYRYGNIVTTPLPVRSRSNRFKKLTSHQPAAFTTVTDLTQLQVYLDKEDFGPGKIDGRRGEFTTKALAHFSSAHDLGYLPLDNSLYKKLPELKQIAPFALYKITAADQTQIGSMAEKRADQGKQHSMPYTSLLSLLSERFHTERAFLKQINPGKNLNFLKVGDIVKVPNVSEPLDVKSLAKQGHVFTARPEFVPRVVKVNTTSKMLDVLEDGRVLASFPITPGSAALPAPRGIWKIANMSRMPFFRYDDMMLNQGVRSDQFVLLPPGPRSPVGVMWMGLNKSGIGLHGTNNPETIGRAASHGCVRLANWDAVKLSSYVTVGTTVKID